MTDVLHLKAKKHGVEIWKSDWKSKNKLAKRASFMFGLYQGGKNVEKEQKIDTNSVKCNTPTGYHGLSLILMKDMLYRNKNAYGMRHHPFPLLSLPSILS